jgi:hypothetical protein
MDKGYSNLYEDIGYMIIDDNTKIDNKFPYKDDIDQRLVKFMRTSYYYKQNNIVQCVPLEMEFDITKNDWVKIKKYLKKYKIKL